MKRILFILLVIGGCLSTINCQQPYVDDAYYWPEADTATSSTPVYDKQMREFIFLEDTTQHPDTIRMRIVYQ
jgi:hypothetical protein